MRFRTLRLLAWTISSAGAFWLAREAWVTPGTLANPTNYAGVACLAALALLALVAGTPYFRAGAWMSLAITGNAIGLQLIEAGKLVRYQHLRLAVENPGKYDFVLIGLIGIQLLLVGAAIRSRISQLWSKLATGFGIGNPGLAVALLCLMILSASPLRNLFRYGTEVLWMCLFELVQAANLYLVVSSVPRDLFRKWARLRRTPWPRHWVDPIAMAATIWVFLASGFLALAIWENHPHIPDEVAYLYQAQYFSQGMLTGSPAPVPKAFEAYLIDCQDRCLSITNPGWPAVLAVGHLIKAPWLVNPFLAAASVFLLFHFLRRLYGLPTARLATCLLAISPWYLFLAMSFMTHSATLFATLGAALLCLKMRDKRSIVYGIMAGLCVGGVSLIRPLDGAIAGGLIGISVLFMPGRRISGLAAVTVGMALTGSLAFVYNQAVTGDPMASPQVNYFDQQWGKGRNAMGFGPDRGAVPPWPSNLDAFPGHSPLEAVFNNVMQATSLNVELFGWGIGSLAPIVLFLTRRRFTRTDLLILFSIVFVAGAYSLYWYGSGPDFGPRYWFLMLPALVALSARSLLDIGKLVGLRRVYVGVGVLAVTTLLTFMPWRAVDKYYRYWGMSPEVRQFLASKPLGKSLILVRGERQPDFASAIAYNPVNLNADAPIFAYESDAATRAQLLKAYPGRQLWILDGPTQTKSGYRLSGPTTRELFLCACDTQQEQAEGTRP